MLFNGSSGKDPPGNDSGTAEEPSAPVPFPGSTLYVMSKTNASAFSGKVQTFRPSFLHYVQRWKNFFPKRSPPTADKTHSDGFSEYFPRNSEGLIPLPRLIKRVKVGRSRNPHCLATASIGRSLPERRATARAIFSFKIKRPGEKCVSFRKSRERVARETENRSHNVSSPKSGSERLPRISARHLGTRRSIECRDSSFSAIDARISMTRQVFRRIISGETSDIISSSSSKSSAGYSEAT